MGAMEIKMNTTPNAIFVDDGGPDAFEFSNNYVRFDALDPGDYVRAWDEATELWASRQARIAESAPRKRLRLPELRKMGWESGGGLR
jgi:hypothetical protein